MEAVHSPTRFPEVRGPSATAPRNHHDRISILYAKFTSEQVTLSEVLELMNLCIEQSSFKTAYQCVQHSLFVCANSRLAKMEVFAVMRAVMSYWRHDCFAAKGSFRLNLSDQRRNVIDDVCTILSSLYEFVRSGGTIGMQGAAPGAALRPEAVALALSEALESRGDYGGALSLLSALMKPEDNPGVDPSYIIFRAAVLMQHIGKSLQACEYLEFIIDDVPAAHGYGKIHILALMYCTYSTRGVQSSYLAEKCEDHLQQMRNEDLVEALGVKRAPQITHVAPIDSVGQTTAAHLPPLSFRSYELFDALVLQALARSEYVFAAELLKYEAGRDHPGRSSVLLTLAEVCVLLNERDQAVASAETAYEIQPLNSDTRNLLLSLAPGVWKDKVRSAPPVDISYSSDPLSPSRRGAVQRGASAPPDDEESDSRPSEAPTNSNRSWEVGSNDLVRVRAIQREEGEGLSDRDAIAKLIGGSWLIKITPRVTGREKPNIDGYAKTSEEVSPAALKLPRIDESQIS